MFDTAINVKSPIFSHFSGDPGSGAPEIILCPPNPNSSQAPLPANKYWNSAEHVDCTRNGEADNYFDYVKWNKTILYNLYLKMIAGRVSVHLWHKEIQKLWLEINSLSWFVIENPTGWKWNPHEWGFLQMWPSLMLFIRACLYYTHKWLMWEVKLTSI